MEKRKCKNDFFMIVYKLLTKKCKFKKILSTERLNYTYNFYCISIKIIIESIIAIHYL